jgi:hypothetical protein
MDLAERVRTEAGGLIVVDAPAGLRDDVAAGLVSGRADLVCFTRGGGVSTRRQAAGQLRPASGSPAATAGGTP